MHTKNYLSPNWLSSAHKWRILKDLEKLTQLRSLNRSTNTKHERRSWRGSGSTAPFLKKRRGRKKGKKHNSIAQKTSGKLPAEILFLVHSYFIFFSLDFNIKHRFSFQISANFIRFSMFCEFLVICKYVIIQEFMSSIFKLFSSFLAYYLFRRLELTVEFSSHNRFVFRS